MGRRFSITARHGADRLRRGLRLLASRTRSRRSTPAVRKAVVITHARPRKPTARRWPRSSGSDAPASSRSRASTFPSRSSREARAAVERAGRRRRRWSFGGGSAIGLGKASRSRCPVRVDRRADDVLGLRDDARLRAHGDRVAGGARAASRRSARAATSASAPRSSLYDPALTTQLPRAVTMASLWNAMAHAVEALWVTGRRSRDAPHRRGGAPPARDERASPRNEPRGCGGTRGRARGRLPRRRVVRATPARASITSSVTSSAARSTSRTRRRTPRSCRMSFAGFRGERRSRRHERDRSRARRARSRHGDRAARASTPACRGASPPPASPAAKRTRRSSSIPCSGTRRRRFASSTLQVSRLFSRGPRPRPPR